MDNIFRSLFGFHRPQRPHMRSHDDEFISPMQPEEHPNEDEPGMNTFLFTNPNDMFRQFDEMFANFERVFQGIGVLEPPSYEFIPGDSNPNSVVEPFDRSPRDKMLKHPDSLVPYQPEIDNDHTDPGRPSLFGRLWSRPQGRHELQKEDCDLDDSVRNGGLDRLFSGSQGREISTIQPHRSSVFKSVTVRTNRTADGKLEETRTIVDGEGTRQTIVSRTIDGQTVRQTTRKNKSGETEVTEDLINMDEDDKKKFNERWSAKSKDDQLSSDFSRPAPRNEALRELDLDNSNSSIFGRLFGFDSSGWCRK